MVHCDLLRRSLQGQLHKWQYELACLKANILHYLVSKCNDNDHLPRMQVDHTLSRLNVLKERIESVEALVTIDLDHRRNELVAFDLVRPIMQGPFQEDQEDQSLLSSCRS